MILYDNPFSPFARKVRMVLAFKGINYESVDALTLRDLPRLRAVSARAEVPVLVDGETIVTESADIVAYLEDVQPTPSIMPATPQLRAKARSWQRLADQVVDAIIHDVSLWSWPTHQREDHPPENLLAAGLTDLEKILAMLEGALADEGFLCGAISIADLAMLPHITSIQRMGLLADPSRFPKVFAWQQRLRKETAVQQDLAFVRQAAKDRFAIKPSPYEDKLVIWRGDRIEWLLAHGFDDWWMKERREGRAVIPRSIA